MKVLHLTAHERSQSGIAHFAAAWRAALAATGVEVTPLRVTPNPCFSHAEIDRYVASVRRAAGQGCDVAHAELGGGTLHEFYGALSIASAGRVPLCLTLHDPPRPVWTPREFGAARDRRGCRLAIRTLCCRQSRTLESTLVQRAQAIFVLSQRGAAAIVRTFPLIDATKVIVIPYPLSCRAPAIRNEAIRDPGAELILGFHGHWYVGKGLEALIDAVAQLAAESPKIRLKLWGEPPPHGGARTGAGYRRRVLRRIELSGAGGRIDVLGRLPERRVAAALASTDAIVLPYNQPSTRKGLASVSGALFDALAAGVPVITADVRALGEFVHDGVNGLLFSADDPRALKATLRRLRDDRLLRVRLREGALRTARELSPELTGARTIDVYEPALTSRSLT